MRPIHFKVIKDNQGNKSGFKRRFLRFHSLCVASVCGGRSNPCLVNCKCRVIGIFKTGSKEKITWPNLLFPVNEELRLPFTILEGSPGVQVLHSWCLTAVMVYLSPRAGVHDRGSFITVASTYCSHCHMEKGIQAVELSASVSPLSPAPGERHSKAHSHPIFLSAHCEGTTGSAGFLQYQHPGKRLGFPGMNTPAMACDVSTQRKCF